MILNTQDLYDKGIIKDNPSWLPKMFECVTCNPKQMYYVTDERQLETEQCLGCMKEGH